MRDLVIRGGMVYDSTGANPFSSPQTRGRLCPGYQRHPE